MKTASIWMSLPCVLAAASLFSPLASHGAEFVVIDEDFEAYDPTRTGSVNAPTVILTTVPDPEPGGSRGTVASIDMSGGGQWNGGAAVPQQVIQLASIGAAPGDTYEFTADVYFPADTTWIDDVTAPNAFDGFTLRSRFQREMGVGTETDRFNQRVEPATTPPSNALLTQNNGFDTWFQLSLTGTIPEVDGGQEAITTVEPIVSFRDAIPTAFPMNPAATDASPGTAVFLDNIRFVVNTSEIDPNATISAANPFSAQTLMDGVQDAEIIVQNAGLTQTLTVSGELSGPDAANFEVFTTLTPADPLEVIPVSDGGGSELIELAFTPGTEERVYRATLTLTTNDPEEPTIAIPLNVLVLPQPIPILLNPGFEVGDITGWSGNNLTASTDFANSGTYSGRLQAQVNTQFNGFNISNAFSPPMVEGSPGIVQITPEMRDQEFRFSGFVYSPSENTFSSDNALTFELRWNATFVARAFFSIVTPDFFFEDDLFPEDSTVDRWIPFEITGFIPFEIDLDPMGEEPNFVPVESAEIVIFSNDLGMNDTGDELIYLDDLVFEIDSAPVVADADLRVTEVTVVPDPNPGATGSFVSITFETIDFGLYTIESSTDLVNWTEVTTGFPEDGADGTPATFSQAVTGDTELLYYRILLEAALAN